MPHMKLKHLIHGLGLMIILNKGDVEHLDLMML